MDLWKTFGTLNYKLLIAKLSICGFHNESLNSVQFYLTNRLQRTKVNKSFSK